MITRRQRAEEGFTLIEVLMAMIVLGLGIAALLAAMATHASTSALNRNQSASESLLTSAAEYVKALPYPSTCSGLAGPVPTSKVPYDTAEFSVTYGADKVGKWDVKGDSLCSIQRVTVTVTALNVVKGFTTSVVVVKRPDIEPTP